MLGMHFWPKKWMRDTCKLSSPQRRNWGRTPFWTFIMFIHVFVRALNSHLYSSIVPYHITRVTQVTYRYQFLSIVVHCASIMYTLSYTVGLFSSTVLEQKLWNLRSTSPRDHNISVKNVKKKTCNFKQITFSTHGYLAGTVSACYRWEASTKVVKFMMSGLVF